MNTAETSGAVVYNFPPQIIERQGWINHLTRYNSTLLAWYIGRETGRLFGVYESNDRLWWAAFKMAGDNIIFDDKASFGNEDDFWQNMRHSPSSGITPAIGKFVGIYKNDPPKPEVKIMAFPGVALPYIPPPAKDNGEGKEKKEKTQPRIFIARPGDPVYQGVPDLRDKLQRPGLILVSYARGRREFSHYGKKRNDTYWLAWWVNTSGAVRYYVSDDVLLDTEIVNMRPECCSSGYCAKGGENYSGGNVSYVVHVAPECMDMKMHSDPDPRIPHIETLKALFPAVDYSIEYRMTDEKMKIAQAKKERKKRAELWQARKKSEGQAENVKEN